MTAPVAAQLDRVINVLDVGEKAEGRRDLLLEVPHAGLAHQSLVGQLLAWTGHPQQPGQPLAEDRPHLLDLIKTYC